MSFELLLKPEDIEKRPWKIFLFSFVISILGFILSIKIFPGYSSVLLVTFIIIPLIPIFVKIIEIEESHYARLKHHILRRHSAVKIFSYMFLGVVLGLSLVYVILPSSMTQSVFSEQRNSLYGISSSAIMEGAVIIPGLCDESALSALLIEHPITDCRLTDLDNDNEPEYLIYENYQKKPSFVYLPQSGRLVSYNTAIRNSILMNNFQLMAFVFLTSFIFGAGAIFILVWNASVIAVFIGEAAFEMAGRLGLHPGAALLLAGPSQMLSIALHAIPEFLGFFITALAGGIIAVALIRHKPGDRAFMNVMKDGLVLFIIAGILLIAAAFIEVL